MQADKIDLYLLTQGKFFEPMATEFLRQKLASLDDSRWQRLTLVPLKDPTVALVLSLFLGYLGVDRFYVGDNTNGVLKLITCGGLGIWTIIDWFQIMRITREKNFNILSLYL